MDNFSEMEARLERLMPRGLSDDFHQEMTVTIDELAAEAELSQGGVGGVLRRMTMNPSARGIAAVLAVSAVSLGIWNGVIQRSSTANAANALAALHSETLSGGGIEVLESSVWIDSGADLGIHSIDEFGEARHRWSYAGVEEERVLHQDTGYEVILQREFEREYYATTSL